MMRILPALLLASLLAACGPTDTPDPSTRRLILRPFERLDTLGRHLEFRIATEQVYPCTNYSIPIQVSRTPNGLSLSLGVVTEPGLCLTAPGPATANVSLGNLAPGTYAVRVDNAGIQSEGTLHLSPEALTVRLPDRSGVKVDPAPLRRILAGTIWGIIGYDTPQQEAGVRAFFTELERLGAQQLPLPQGDYGYFQTDASGQLMVPQPSGYWFAKGFIYRYDGHSRLLRTLVRQTYLRNGGTVHPNLSTSRGEEFFGYLP